MDDHLENASLENVLIHADRELNVTSAVAAPIYQTANFAGSSPEDFLERSRRPRHPEFYTRYRNPNAAAWQRAGFGEILPICSGSWGCTPCRSSRLGLCGRIGAGRTCKPSPEPACFSLTCSPGASATRCRRGTRFS